jgi:DAK2 domain fusion protein YloV
MKNEEEGSLAGRTELTAAELMQLLEAATAHLERNKETVNALNVFPVPDGDTGTNMLLTLQSTLAELRRSPMRSMREFAEATTRGSLLGARGNSGVILSQLFRGISRSFDSKETITTHDLADAFVEASRTAYKAVMKPVEGTMLTVARESSHAALLAQGQTRIEDFLAAVLHSARRSLANTPNLLPILREAGVVDSGGQGLVFMLEGALACLRGESLERQSLPSQASFDNEEAFAEELLFRYDIQFLLRDCHSSRQEVEECLTPMGDSLLVIGETALLRVHVHSNQPAQVLDLASRIGTLDQVTMEDMLQQHQEFKEKGKSPPCRGVALAVVAVGAGFEEIFSSLGVAKMVPGGQSMNPSTKDILDAIDTSDCQEWVILPNNSNVIGTALQAKSISQKKLSVVPTRNLPQGISACLSYSQECTLEENALKMEQAIKRVHCGEITYAVRDGRVNGVTFQTGEVIGLIDDELVEVGEDPGEVSCRVVRKMIGRTHPEVVVTLYRGEEAAEEEAEELRDQLAAEFPQAELEQHYGGQPFYYYIISLEE